MGLYKVIFATTFGRGSSQPLKSAYVRIGVVWVAALLLGITMAQSLDNVPIHYTGNNIYLLGSVAFVAQLVVLLPLLSATGLLQTSHDTLTRMLLVLPLKQHSRWLAYLLPSATLAIIAITLAGYPLTLLALKAGVPTLLMPVALTGGILAAFGIVHSTPRQYRLIQLVTTPLILWGEYKLLSIMNSPGTDNLLRLTAALLFVALLASLSLLFLSSSTRFIKDTIYVVRNKRVYGSGLPPVMWFVRKVWRATPTRLGFLVTLLLSSGAAAIGAKQAFAGADTFALLAALLASAFCSDIRPLCRREHPAEIASLKGSAYFMFNHIFIAFATGLLAVSPLIWSIHLFGIQTLLLSLLQIAIGMATGIFAGTLIVAKQRDILGQCMASLLCIGVLLLPAHVTAAVGSLSVRHVVTYQVFSITLLLLASWAIEYKRNTYIWRIHVR